MTVRDLEIAILQRERVQADIRSVRIYCPHEMDVLSINRSGYCTEFEIKMSRADFRADFKKGKHKQMEKGEGGMVKRFYFVTPKGLVDQSEIPPYAGLIEVELVDNMRHAYEVIQAPNLRCRKINQSEKLRVYRSMMYRFLNNQYKDLLNAIV